MKKQMFTHRFIRYSIALVFTLILNLAIWSPTQAQSAEPAVGNNMTEAKMMEQCQEMKEHKQKMKEDMKAQDAELTNQIKEMNRAPMDKKINLMAAVITRMVEQRIAMDAKKAKMEEKMMQHMMQHMQLGKESMSQCPMMKGMKDMKDMKDIKDMKEESGDANKEHQHEHK